MPARAPDRDDQPMKVLVIVNDQPYGSERPYNALRLASALAKRDEVELRVFLIGDAVACAIAGQQLPDGHYHLDRMLKGLLHRARGRLLRHLPRRPRPQPRTSSSKAHASLDARGADRLDALGGQGAHVLRLRRDAQRSTPQGSRRGD